MSLNRSIDSFLNQARIAIDNALGDPKILAYLSTFGYSKARLQLGRTHYETLLAAQQKQQLAYGYQITATASLNTAWATAKKSYMRFIKIARIAFKQQNGIAPNSPSAAPASKASPAGSLRPTSSIPTRSPVPRFSKPLANLVSPSPSSKPVPAT